MKTCEYNDELSSIMTPEESKPRSYYDTAEEAPASVSREDPDAIHIMHKGEKPTCSSAQ